MNKLKIATKNGIYEYIPVNLYYGRKIIDIDAAKRNLLDFKKILDENSVRFGIIYGTLLGAIREKDLIAHDEDIDVFIFNEDRDDFLSLLFILREDGFEVARYEKDLLSVIRDDDYIDIYFFRKSFFNRRICAEDSISCVIMGNYDNTINFLGENFITVKEPIKFLEKCYGKDWRIPKKNSPGTIPSFEAKTKQLIKMIMPNKFIQLLKKLNISNI